jgi:hypothetical protein
VATSLVAGACDGNADDNPDGNTNGSASDNPDVELNDATCELAGARPSAVPEIFSALVGEWGMYWGSADYPKSYSISMQADGQYTWTLFDGDYFKTISQGRFTLRASGLHSGFLILRDVQSLAGETSDEASGDALLPFSMNPGEPGKLQLGDMNFVSSSVSTSSLVPPSVMDDLELPPLYCNLSAAPWIRANGFDRHVSPDRIEYRTDGTIVATNNHLGCDLHSTMCLGPTPSGLRPIPFSTLNSGHACELYAGDIFGESDVLDLSKLPATLVAGQTFVREASQLDSHVFVARQAEFHLPETLQAGNAQSWQIHFAAGTLPLNAELEIDITATNARRTTLALNGVATDAIERNGSPVAIGHLAWTSESNPSVDTALDVAVRFPSAQLYVIVNVAFGKSPYPTQGTTRLAQFVVEVLP